VGLFRKDREARSKTKVPAPNSVDADRQKHEDAAAAPLPAQLLWLIDAPMFIDEHRVEAFYDAILRPDFEGASLTLSESLTKGRTFSGGMTVGAALPWLVKAEGKAEAASSRQKARGQEATLHRVINPYRHLLALAIHYATQQEFQHRLVFAQPTTAKDAAATDVSSTWTTDSFSRESPRAIVVLDLPEGTPLIPLAAETTEGKVVPVYKQLAARLQRPGQRALPEFVRRDKPNYLQGQRDYWRWFAEFFDPQVAIEVVEEASESGRFAWIAFRLPVGSVDPLQAETFLHLHISPRGEYDTGVVAYNFIARGYEHGVRIVGTLKSDPDLNVLAVFER
jgi:hypothetical protein